MMDTEVWEVWLVAALAIPPAYLFGSIPFGLLLTRAAGLGDIRRIGSGNIGATNVLRTGHKGLAALTLVLDILKGAAAVLAARTLAGLAAGTESAIPAGMTAGASAFLGHLFPVWLGFKGGKGVATYIGVLLGLLWPVAIIFCSLWIGTALTSRYSSFSALTASLATPVAAWALGEPALAIFFALLTALVFFKHRDNIRRLAAGVEPKIGVKT